MGENRKAVNAILRKVAKKAERAKGRAVTCPKCKSGIERWWNWCAVCGGLLSLPSYIDRPFACPPDEPTKQGDKS